MRRNEMGRTSMNYRTVRTVLAGTAVVWSGLGDAAVMDAGSQVGQAVGLETKAVQAAAASQQRIDALKDEAGSLAAAERNTRATLSNLQAYDAEVGKLVAGQRDELRGLQRQIADIDVTERQLAPLARRILADLDDFVAHDLPFDAKARSEHLADLHAMMDDPSVPVVDKYRRVMQAYRRELGYGYDVGAYRGSLSVGGVERQVEFLRIGRIALLYRSRDGHEAGYWDSARRRWVPGGAALAHEVARGMAMAHNQAAPNLIEVPVSAAAHD